MLEAAEKVTKRLIITVFVKFQNLSRDMEDIKKIQIKLVEMKTATFKIQNISEGINNR